MTVLYALISKEGFGACCPKTCLCSECSTYDNRRMVVEDAFLDIKKPGRWTSDCKGLFCVMCGKG
jgi:hypothetical protein